MEKLKWVWDDISLKDKLITSVVILVIVCECIFNVGAKQYVYKTVNSNIPISESRNNVIEDETSIEINDLTRKIVREAFYVIFACYLEPFISIVAKGFSFGKRCYEKIDNDCIRICVEIGVIISGVVNILPLYAGMMQSSKIVDYFSELLHLFSTL